VKHHLRNTTSEALGYVSVNVNSENFFLSVLIDTRRFSPDIGDYADCFQHI